MKIKKKISIVLVILSLTSVSIFLLYQKYSFFKNIAKNYYEYHRRRFLRKNNPDYEEYIAQILSQISLPESDIYEGNFKFYNNGDVLAFELTSDNKISSYVHSKLILWGVSIYGLWVRSINDTIRK